MSEIDHTHGLIAAVSVLTPTIGAWIKQSQKKQKIQEFLDHLEDTLEDDIISKAEIRKLLRLGRKL